MTEQFFLDRQDAGRKLAAKLSATPNSLVLALPRGGVPVGFEVASFLKVPLDILAVKKIGAPNQPEFAIGALSEDGVPVFQERTLRMLGLTKKDLSTIATSKFEELKKQLELFRKAKCAESVEGKNIIIVDDGVATGATMLSAIRILKNRKAKRITVAVPVIAKEARNLLSREANELVTLYAPDYFDAVGNFYLDFRQIENDEVADLLRKSNQRKQTENQKA